MQGWIAALDASEDLSIVIVSLDASEDLSIVIVSLDASEDLSIVILFFGMKKKKNGQCYRPFSAILKVVSCGQHI
jgi:hypothetical protein